MATRSSILPGEPHGHRGLAGRGPGAPRAGRGSVHGHARYQGCTLGSGNHFKVSLLVSQAITTKNSDLVRPRQRLERVASGSRFLPRQRRIKGDQQVGTAQGPGLSLRSESRGPQQGCRASATGCRSTPGGRDPRLPETLPTERGPGLLARELRVLSRKWMPPDSSSPPDLSKHKAIPCPTYY